MNQKGDINVFLLVIITIIVLSVSGYFIYNKTIANNSVLPEIKKTEGIGNDKIIVSNPMPDQLINSPIEISGKANIFGNTINVIVKDDNEKILTKTYVQTENSEEDLKNFSKQIFFNKPSTRDGIIEFFELSQGGEEINKVVIFITFEEYEINWDEYKPIEEIVILPDLESFNSEEKTLIGSINGDKEIKVLTDNFTVFYKLGNSDIETEYFSFSEFYNMLKEVKASWKINVVGSYEEEAFKAKEVFLIAR